MPASVNSVDGISPSAAADEDEDDETCGFCIFMKAGGCKTEFKVKFQLCRRH